MSESNPMPEGTPPAPPAPPREPEVTPPRLKSSSSPREALEGIHEEQIRTLSEALEIQRQMLEELRTERDAQQIHSAALEDASSRVEEKARALEERISQLEERLRVQPSLPPPADADAPPRTGKKRPRWL